MAATLYERLGAAHGIARLVDDIVERHLQNPAIRARFLPYRDEPERLATVKGHLRAFLTAGSGGPGEYAGRSMPAAHRGMNISEAEYVAALDDILKALDALRIDPETRKEVLAIAYSLKDEIMHQ
ncbi:MAG: group I truncated hemoglobin [Pseudomonadota bacterium]